MKTYEINGKKLTVHNSKNAAVMKYTFPSAFHDVISLGSPRYGLVFTFSKKYNTSYRRVFGACWKNILMPWSEYYLCSLSVSDFETVKTNQEMFGNSYVFRTPNSIVPLKSLKLATNDAADIFNLHLLIEKAEVNHIINDPIIYD